MSKLDVIDGVSRIFWCFKDNYFHISCPSLNVRSNINTKKTLKTTFNKKHVLYVSSNRQQDQNCCTLILPDSLYLQIVFCKCTKDENLTIDLTYSNLCNILQVLNRLNLQ